MYELSKRLFRNPVLNFALATLVALALFFLSEDIIEISYSISSPEVIAEKPDEAPELTFRWKDQLIEEDLKRLKIAVWNSGNTHIDFASISTTNKLRLKVSGNFTVVSQKATSKSRESLGVSTVLENDTDQYILIDLDGDDALEINDGFIISVFYVGEDDPEVILQGRVKGINGGFDKVEWKSIKSSLEGASVKVYLVLALMFFSGVVLYMCSKGYLNDVPVFKNLLYEFIAPLIAIFYIGTSVGLALGIVEVVYHGLTWVD